MRLPTVLLVLFPALALPAQETPQKPTTPPPAAPVAPATPPPPVLTFETVLQKGGELLPQLPVVQWLPGGHEVAMVVAGQGRTEMMQRGVPGGGAMAPVTDARKALAAIGQPVAADAPARFPAWSWRDASTLRFVAGDAVYHWQPGAEKATRVLSWPATLDSSEGGAVLAPSPADAAVAYGHAYDLWLANGKGGIRRLTFDGSADIRYGIAAHRAEFGIHDGLFWSSDGRWLAFYREDQRGIALYPYQDLDAMPPAPRHGRYPMAGRAQGKVQVGVVDTTTGALHWLEGDPDADLFWTNVTFAPDGKSVIVAQVNRGQDRMQLVRFDSATGRRLQVLLEAQDSHWIEPEHGPTFLADGRFLWWSSKDGHDHLYLHDADGKLLLQVTRGAFDVQQLLGLGADQSTLWFVASGEDPRQKHLFQAKIDGSEVKQVTRERGCHQPSLAADCSFAFDTWSNLETPPQQQFLNLQNGAAEPLPPAANPLAAYRQPAQRMFQVKAEDDTVLYGHAILPPDLQEGKKYPVLLYVYGGPHSQLVTDSWLANAPLWLHGLAGSGYVIARLDNRGTPNRGIAFAQAIHRRLGTLEVQDQLRAIEWLKQQPFVDPARIGVHGWSYGGYMTLRCMLLAPDVFACGVAGAPVTDWAMYETGYGERYMDTPAENPDGYRDSSCLPLAGKLKGRLLLVHGTDDLTVMWSHSLRFVDRCIEAGVLLDYFPYPMQTHGLVGKDRRHFLRLLKDFLDRQLHPGG